MLRRILRSLVCVSIVTLSLACVRGQIAWSPAALAAPPDQPAAGGAAAAASADAPGRSRALLAILDEHLDWLMREDPVMASGRGDERFNDKLRDESPAAYARRLLEITDRLTRLKAIDAADFTEDDRVDADLLAYELATAIEGARFHGEQMPVDTRSGPQVWLPQMADSLPFRTPKHYADYATRLESIPAQIDQAIEQMRAGLAAKRVPPRVVVKGADEGALALGSEEVASKPTLSPFYKPFAALPARDAAGARAQQAIRAGICPAYHRLGVFLRDEYIPACRDTVGIGQGVDGPALYDYLLRAHTTTNLTAEEIHAIGLREVARIRAEMFEVIGRTDYPNPDHLAGDALFAAFVEYLRTAARFYYDSPEALLAGYRDVCKRIDAQLPRLFRTLPRNTYGVRPMPAFSAPASPTAYYHAGSIKAGVAGYFVANTYRVDQRPKYEMIALALHESVPGHHLQITLAQELTGVHPFRTLENYTAFVEGWALYAERLGLEMNAPEAQGAPDGRNEGGAPASGGAEGSGGSGVDRGLYADPYDDFGRLTYEMWRACRLVVDTGLHAKGWTRRQAIEFMLTNTALSPLNIQSEVDRYIGWPGQACAYKIGQMKISELRARAERALADRFDLRAFHDTVLGAGAMPLPALEARMDRWIKGVKG